MPSAKLILEGKTIELPIIEGTEKEKAVDITKLRAETGYITLDSGYMNTGSCTSAITYLNGEEGVLKHRGYPIEVLAEESNFLEVCFLVMYGELPSKERLKKFHSRINRHNSLPEGIAKIIETFPKDAHPMGVLSSCIAALSAYYPQYLKANLDQEEIEEVSCILLAQVKIIAAQFYRHSSGKDIISSEPNRGYCNDFMNMMFQDGKGYDVDDEVAAAINKILILHADHEQNCSASAVRLVGSSQANPFATMSAGIDALWGPLHGGANQAVLEMLEAINQDGGGYKKFLEKAKDKNDPFRLMGFGHRVYKNFDPRSKIIKKYSDIVLKKLGVEDPLLDLAKGLAEEALSDSYFIERKLYPNVDFYSGIIYRALGIPVNMFTVMFVIGRMPGWLAQWREMLLDPSARICRPRQIYTGETKREFVPLSER